jgi:hypothetical protein
MTLERIAVRPFARNDKADCNLFELIFQTGDFFVLPSHLDFGRGLVPRDFRFHLCVSGNWLPGILLLWFRGHRSDTEADTLISHLDGQRVRVPTVE